MKKVTRISRRMARVLHSIIHPRRDDDPFPPENTIKALLNRKMIRVVKPRTSVDTIMGALCAERIIATKHGKEALIYYKNTGGDDGEKNA